MFSDAERAALDLAQAAGSVPNTVTDQQFENLKLYYSEDEIVDIVAVIAYFGFLNRWNDSLATPLEESPIAFAESHLGTHNWVPIIGKLANTAPAIKQHFSSTLWLCGVSSQ
jgi:hypothetical protein